MSKYLLITWVDCDISKTFYDSLEKLTSHANEIDVMEYRTQGYMAFCVKDGEIKPMKPTFVIEDD